MIEFTEDEFIDYIGGWDEFEKIRGSKFEQLRRIEFRDLLDWMDRMDEKARK